MAEYVHIVRHSHLSVGIPTTRRTNPHWDSQGWTQQNYPATHPGAPRVSGTPPGPLAYSGTQISPLPTEGREAPFTKTRCHAKVHR